MKKHCNVRSGKPIILTYDEAFALENQWGLKFNPIKSIKFQRYVYSSYILRSRKKQNQRTRR